MLQCLCRSLIGSFYFAFDIVALLSFISGTCLSVFEIWILFSHYKETCITVLKSSCIYLVFEKFCVSLTHLQMYGHICKYASLKCYKNLENWVFKRSKCLKIRQNSNSANKLIIFEKKQSCYQDTKQVPPSYKIWNLIIVKRSMRSSYVLDRRKRLTLERKIKGFGSIYL